MSDYLTEDEQIEILKRWIKEYSLVVILGILIAVAAASGWRFWQQRQANRLAHASSTYSEMLHFQAQNDNKNTLVQAQKILKHYPSSPYGELAALVVTKETLTTNPAGAKDKLQWLLDNGKIDSFRQIARLRLARIFLAEKKPAESLRVLDTVDDKAFLGFIKEVKGDAYFAQGKLALARESYSQALAQIPNAQQTRPILQIKYDNLASTT